MPADSVQRRPGRRRCAAACRAAARAELREQRPLAAGTLVRVPLGRRDVAGHRLAGRARHGTEAELRPVAEVSTCCRRWARPGCALVDFAAVLLPAQRRRDRARRSCRRNCAGSTRPALANRIRRLEKALAAGTGAGAMHAAPSAGAAARRPRRRRRSPRSPTPLALADPATRAAARRHRQRQDRGLPARRRAGARARPAGAGAGARDQPHAAARGALRGALRRPPHRLAAQRPHAGAAAAQLARGPPRPGRPGARHAAGGVRVDAAARPHRRRRGARPFVQAAGRRALLGARPRGLPRPHRAALVLLGSATPSLETWHRADTVATRGRPARPHRRRRLPAVRLVDMGTLPRAVGAAHRARSAAAAGRGAAAAHRARRAEPRLPEPPRLRAGAALRRVRLEERLPALQRLARLPQARPDAALPPLRPPERVPRACPECGNLDIAPIGRGTERLEEQLAGARAESAAASRASTPTARARKGALEAQLGAVHAGDVDVLVGTQMVAKGHDFRRITLVAAVNPDSSLFSSDFRAPERLFALLMQAGGPAGRDAARPRASEMWVQTWHPTHPLYAALHRHDFAAFAEQPARERRAAGLPPFSHLAVLRAEARSADAARAFLAAAASSRAPSRTPRGDALRTGAARRSPGSPTSSACRCWSNRIRGRRCSASSRLAAGCTPAARAQPAGRASCAGPSTSIRRDLTAAGVRL